jgi:hypothetical protein
MSGYVPDGFEDASELDLYVPTLYFAPCPFCDSFEIRWKGWLGDVLWLGCRRCGQQYPARRDES